MRCCRPLEHKETTQAQEAKQALSGGLLRAEAPAREVRKGHQQTQGQRGGREKSGSHTQVGGSRSQGLDGLLMERDGPAGPGGREEEARNHTKPPPHSQDKEGMEGRDIRKGRQKQERSRKTRGAGIWPGG